jgi:hypothetical protein
MADRRGGGPARGGEVGVASMWDGVAVVEGVAGAGSGAANAVYFARTARRARGPRRGAAALLSLLFGGAALAAAHAAGQPDAAAAVALAPLLAANLVTNALVWAGAGR